MSFELRREKHQWTPVALFLSTKTLTNSKSAIQEFQIKKKTVVDALSDKDKSITQARIGIMLVPSPHFSFVNLLSKLAWLQN